MSGPTVISTFSGPGGSSLGYERAGCDVRVALDCAPDKFSNAIPETYRRNHPETTFLEQDARETTGEELLNAAGIDKRELDIIDGSPPCSPFSGANTQQAWGDHESGTLFDRYTYFIEEMQPRTFVAENVPDLAEGKTKGYYKTLCENLRDAGYNLQVQNIDAAYLGAAHHRRRLMFLGVRNDVGSPPTIKPTQRPTTVREAWDGLEDLGNTEFVKKKAERSTVYKWIKKLPADAKTSTADVRTDGSESFFQQRRLSYRKPAFTFTYTPHNFIHPSKDRYLTIPEVKRLIGIPDSYELPDDYNNAWECCIRCLPPILLETIANKLQQTVLN
jgi:DNA (cytosine-5)-methyltransferase 1